MIITKKWLHGLFKGLDTYEYEPLNAFNHNILPCNIFSSTPYEGVKKALWHKVIEWFSGLLWEKSHSAVLRHFENCAEIDRTFKFVFLLKQNMPRPSKRPKSYTTMIKVKKNLRKKEMAIICFFLIDQILNFYKIPHKNHLDTLSKLKNTVCLSFPWTFTQKERKDVTETWVYYITPFFWSNNFTPAKKTLHDRWLWWLRHLEGLHMPEK